MQAIASSDVATPTWTGHHGSAGAPSTSRGRGPQRRFGTVTNRRLLPSGSAATAATAGAGRGAASRTPSPAVGRQRGGVAAGSAGSSAAGVSDVSASAEGIGSVGLAAGRSASGGVAGAVAPRGSSALLEQMRARQRAAIAAGSSEHGDAHDATAAAFITNAAGPSNRTPSPSPSPGQLGQQGDEGADLLAAQLVSFLESRGGEAPSDVLVDAFQGQVPPARMPLFKALLKRVAVMTKRPGGGVWVLRPDYVADAAAGAAGGGGTSS